MSRRVIQTDEAPTAIGTYSQALQANHTVYLSGQIPIDPQTTHLRTGPIEPQIEQVISNLSAVATAAGGSLRDIVKINVYLTNLANFPKVNEIMEQHFEEPYPARAVVQVAALPLGADVEMDAILVIDSEPYSY
jgi:reactive intermediate/imine deaminase